MTRAELDRQLGAYARHAKLTVALFFGALLVLVLLLVITCFAFRPGGVDPGLATSLGLFLLLTVGLVVWRWVVYLLARRHHLVCPHCRKNVLGMPAEGVLTSVGQCFYCGSQIVSDAHREN